MILGNPEIDNQTLQEEAENPTIAETDPIVGSSPAIDSKEEADQIDAEPSAASDLPDSTTVFAPVYVEYPGGEEEEDSVPPPRTSPYLEEEGAAAGASTSGHVQTGHSPSAPSRPPRIRGTKGGRKEQTKRLIKRWQADFDELADFLWDEARFWLKYVHHSEASAELIWTVRVFRVLYNHCTANQILVHFANTHTPYRNWTFYKGYRTGEGLRAAPNLVANTVLPDRDHINLQAFGDPDPPSSVWDDYNTYRGAQPKGKSKGSVFVQNTEPPSPPEDNSTLGTDPAMWRDLSTSEETHTPSPRGPPKAKPRPKEQPKKPREPDHPPPWVPSLRPVDHPAVPKVTESVASVPPPRVAEGAAAKRSNSKGPKQPSEPAASGEASVPEPSKPKASEPKVAKPPKDNPLKRLGPPPTYPAPPVPVHRDFHQTLYRATPTKASKIGHTKG